MGSYIFDFFGLGQDFKKVGVGKEIKASKHRSFRFKILFKAAIDSVEHVVHTFEGIRKGAVFSETGLEHVGSVLCVNLDFSPTFINSLEFFRFSGQLLHDVRGVENWLQVSPLHLALEPLFHRI
jgi:hypothetical protein